jgi:maltooligosyltrehalose trehalohydrolase
MAVLDWDALLMSPHRERLTMVRALLKARREHVVPLVRDMSGGADARIDGDVLTAEWRAGDRRLQLVANLSEAVKQRPSLSWGAPIWGGPLPQELPPWSVYAGVGGA